MITLYHLVASLLNVDFKDLMGKGKNFVPIATEQTRIYQLALEFVADNIKLIAFAIVPFHAIASRYIFFRRRGLNFLEHLVIPFYLMGHGYWLSIISVTVYAITGSLFFNLWLVLILIPYYGFGYASFFPEGGKVKSFFKGIGIYLGGQLIMTAFITMIALIVVLILTQVSPETLNFLKPSLNR